MHFGGAILNSPAEHVADQARPDLASKLRLALISGVGPRLRQALLDRFGDAESVLAAAPSDLRTVPGIGAKLCRAISRADDEVDVAALLKICQENAVRILTDDEEPYPRLLKEIHDPPSVLFVRGAFEPRDAMAIAIVGTRHATAYGLRQAERLGGSLARAGLTVVSGLARGVDAAAHRGALAAGGRTIAVLASGVLTIAPPEHKSLADEIAGQGALISETPPQAAPKSGVFPQRNRLISGLTLGTIVVEAADRSGALITARHAMEQGREVFAVPGPVDSRASRGCHRLLRDGARLVESAEDVLEELGPLVEGAETDDGRIVLHPAELLLNELEQQVLSAVGTEPTSIDQVAIDTALPPHRVLAAISVLEMRHLLRRVSGNLVCRL